MQSRLAACLRHLYIQIELAPAQRAEVRYRPSKPTQMQHRLGKTRGLPQCQAKQVLERQTKLDCCIRELPTASAFATCRGKPAHTLVQPHRQRASSFEGCVVLLPVAGSIAGFAGLTHAASLPLEEQRFMQQRRVGVMPSPTGVVQQGPGKVTIKHGEIKNLDMPPMTMVFTMADPSMLTNLKVGDKVRFVVEQQNGKMVITQITPAS